MTNSAASDLVRQACDLIRHSDHFVAFTGAGISTPSGIPDFRSTGSGLWTQSDPMQVASLSAFRYHPDRFFDWLRPLAQKIGAAQPNPAHDALARLEQACLLKAIITQNIDGLHQRAGSREVIEVHGSAARLTCSRCGQIYPMDRFLEPFISEGIFPSCDQCQTYLKPNITLFEELLPAEAWERAYDQSRAADCYMVIGSSLEVSPANGLPQLAYQNGAKLIINTRSATFLDRKAHVILREDAAAVLPALMNQLIVD